MAPHKRGAGYFLFVLKTCLNLCALETYCRQVGFVSSFCICVWKLEYFNQCSYRISLRTDMMVDSLLHAQWRGSQNLLPCMAECLAADGWPSNRPNYFWFCMKLISMQGCWVAVWLSNGFSLFSLFSFSPFCLPWKYFNRCQSHSR